MFGKVRDLATNGTVMLECLLFAKNDPDYVPAHRLFVIPSLGALIAVFGVFYADLFTKIPHHDAVWSGFWFLYTLCGINLLLHMKRVFDIPSAGRKIMYFIFLAATSLAAAMFFYVIFAWIFTIIIVLVLLFILLYFGSIKVVKAKK